MIFMGLIFVLAYANNLNVPAWAWVLFGLQVFCECVTAAIKALKD